MTLQEFYNKALQMGATPESQMDFDIMTVRKINEKPVILIS